MSARLSSLVILLAAACGSSPASEAPSGKGGAGGPSGRATPVQTAPIEQRDVPIWIEGLGSVTAQQQVLVKTQVDGRLDSVTFKEGDPIHKGDVLAQIDPRPFAVQLHTAEGQLKRDQATLHDAQLNLDRNKDLVKQKLVAQQAVDDLAAQAAAAEGTVRIDEAAIESANLNLSYAVIKSPLDGVAGIRMVDAGNIVHAADANGIVILTQLDPIAVIFTLPEDDLPRVARAKETGELVIAAWSRDGKQLLGTGTLGVIDNQINVSSATLRLKAVFENSAHKLWPNQFVKARLLLRTEKNALVVPSVAIQQGPQGSYLFTVNDDQTVAQVPVTVGDITGESTIVTGDGLKAGIPVIVEGQNQVRVGSRVLAHVAGQSAGSQPTSRPSGENGQGPGMKQHGGKKGGATP